MGPECATALVFAGGDRPPPTALDGLLPADLVIAADSGLDARARARRARSTSSSATSTRSTRPTLDAAVAAGAVVERHPAAKDATDLELALDAARDRGADRGRRGRRATAAGSTTSSPTCCCSRRRRSPTSRVDARARRRARRRRARPRRARRRRRATLCSLLPVGGPRRRRAHRRAALPAAPRDARARLDPRRQQRVPRAPRAASRSSGGVLLAVVPHSGKAA